MYVYLIETAGTGASLVAQMVKNLPAMQETWIQSLGQGDPMEEGMATHSSILAWETSWTEEGSQSRTQPSVQTHTLTRAVRKVREKAIPTILTHDNRVLWTQSAETDISSIRFPHLAVGADMPTVRILLWTLDFYQHWNSGSMQITVHTEWRFSSFLQQHELDDQHIQEWDRTSGLIGKKLRETGELWCLVHLPNRKKARGCKGWEGLGSWDIWGLCGRNMGKDL